MNQEIKSSEELIKKYGDGVENIAQMSPRVVSKLLGAAKFFIAVSSAEGSFRTGLRISLHELRHALNDRGGGRMGVTRNPISQEPINWFYESDAKRAPEERMKISSGVGRGKMSPIDWQIYNEACKEIFDRNNLKKE